MKCREFRTVLILCVGMLLPAIGRAHEPTALVTPKRVVIPFTENKGQWASQILFRSELSSGAVFLERDGWVYSFWDDAPVRAYFSRWHDKNFNRNHEANGFVLKGHSYRMRFAGSRPVQPKAQQPTGSYHNYFTGSDRSRWAGGARQFESVLYPDLYAHTDARVYKVDIGMKYDLILHPGAQVQQIRLQYTGADSLWVSDGKFYIKTSVNTVVEQRPYAYQFVGDRQEEVPCRFVLHGNELGFELPGGYNTSSDLVIDPLLIFATYSGSTADNFGHTATYDSKGHLYAGGITSSNLSGTYPTDTGSYQQVFGGGTGPFPCDITISKYSPNGDSLLYATYLGGNGNDFPHSLVCDNNDELVVMGTTFSRFFPVTPTAYDTSYNLAGDIIVTKFSEDGKQLLGSTFIGGNALDGQNANWTQFEVNACPLAPNYADGYRGDIVFDNNNDYYIATCTRSTNFPTTANAIQSTFGGLQDAVVFKLSSDLTTLEMSTFYGGNKEDAFYSIRLNRAQELFIGGGTSSTNFQTSNGAAQGAYQGGTADGVLVHLNKTADTVISATYVGTPSYDQVYFIDVDRKSFVYLTGQTDGTFPIFPSTIYNKPNSGQFLMKVNKAMNTVIFSTVFGSGQGSPDISPSAFLVDNCENIYISGWGGSLGTGTSTSLLPVTPSAVQPATDGRDFYIAVFGKNADSLLYATYFGGNQTADHVDGGTSRFDKRGVIYQSVCSSCPETNPPVTISDFPTTSNAVFKTNVSPRCSNASLKIDLQIGNFLEANFTPAPVRGCAPLQVTCTNKSIGGVRFDWTFGDGNSSAQASPTHTYTTGGTYEIWLRVIDSATCTVVDSISKTVVVLPTPKAAFTTKSESCAEEVIFEDKSQGAVNWSWNFGDGTTDSIPNPKHTYSISADYQVKLVVNKNKECPDSIIKTVTAGADSLNRFYFANVFTPNNDGINDGWFVKGLDPDCNKIVLHIYNRWGELMFKTTNVQEKWYGTSPKGLHAPAGTYYFVADVTHKSGEVTHKAGSITLLRD